MGSPMIREAHVHDAATLARIYSHYTLHTAVSFEEQAVSTEDMEHRIDEVRGSSLPWLVVEVDAAVLGFAYASKWKGRCAYRFAAETTIYLDAGAVGRGLGRAIYVELLERLRKKNLHVAIGGIALPNTASVALHERLGFAQVAHFREVGFKFGKWVDVGYWELTL